MSSYIYRVVGTNSWSSSATFSRTSRQWNVGGQITTYWNFSKLIGGVTYYYTADWTPTMPAESTRTKETGNLYDAIDRFDNDVIGTLEKVTVYSVVVSSNGNGTASIISGTISVNGVTSVITGGTLSIKASPSTNYRLKEWKNGDSVVVSNPSGTAGEITSQLTVTSDLGLVAYFEQYMFKLEAVTSDGGTISLSGWSSGSYFEADTTKTATAIPSEGYKFVGWFRTGETTPNYTTATANLKVYSSSTKYTAVFANKFHALDVSPNYSNLGSVKLYIDGTEQTATTGLFVEEGSELRVVATPEWFCLFTDWAIDSASVGYADHTFDMPTADCSAVAKFSVRDSFTLSITKENPTFGTVSLYRASNILLATDTGSSLVETAYENVAYTLKYTLADSVLYRFIGWYNDSNELISMNENITLTVSDASATNITAKFDNNPNYTLSANVSDGNDYVSGNPAESAGNEVEISTEADFSGSPPSWLSNTDISILAIPVTGWSLAGWFLDATADVTYDDVPPDNPLVINLASNSVLTAHFSINTYQVGVGLDSSSADHGSVSVSYTPTGGSEQTGSPLTVTHGDTLTFSVTPDAGYTFDGWYKDGVKVAGSTASYTTPAIVAACVYTCKLTAVVSIVADATGDGAVGFLDADGNVIIGEAISGGYKLDVVLGESVRVRAYSTLGTDYFQKWYATGDTNKAPLAVFSSDTTFIVTETTGITALFSATPVSRFLMVTNGTDGVGMGTVSSSAGTAITRAAFVTGVGAALGTIPAEVTGDKFYSFNSIATTIVGCTPSSGKVFVKWQIKRAGESSFSDYSTDISAQLVMSSDCIVRAVYQTASPLLIKASYATGSDISCGTFLIEPDGTGSVQTSFYKSAYFSQGSEVTLSAIPANGYVFIGWYGTAEGSGAAVSTSASYTFTVSTTVSLYAKFDQDDNAIYKWDGGTANKIAEWRSKRFVASKPFNPSCAKVYSTTYPITLSLYMCSSPDAPSTTPKVEVTIRKQDGVRLPMARPEKYFEIRVKASSEVSEISVSTFMEGLAQ